MQSRDLLKLWNLGNILRQNANGFHCVVPDAEREDGVRHGRAQRKKIIQREEMASLIQFQSRFFDFCSLLAGIITALDEQVEIHPML